MRAPKFLLLAVLLLVAGCARSAPQAVPEPAPVPAVPTVSQPMPATQPAAQPEPGAKPEPVPRPGRKPAPDKAPYLERVNVTNGSHERLMAMPPEIIDAIPSPEGRHLALTGWEKRADRHDGWWPTRLQLVDLANRQILPVTMEAGHVAWRPGGILVNLGIGLWGEKPGWLSWNLQASGQPVEHRGGPTRFARLSPDGRFAAYIASRADEAGSTNEMVPLALVIHDLESGKEHRVDGFSHGISWGKDGDWSQWVAWSPDGRQLATLDPVSERGRRTDLVVYDLSTKERRVVRENTGIPPWGARLYWSPDGKWLLATGGMYESAVIPLDGGAPVKLAGGGRNLAFWDATGSRLLNGTDWVNVYVYWPATGKQLDLGPGLPAGWDGYWAYIIRWPGSDKRYIAPQL
ncbi:MAG TPA: hypothetical protein VK464_23425 [Symbiobacteriaceae bacterium]|nr:hypothetical protein [Symbiobacteriaceae bacterium]